MTFERFTVKARQVVVTNYWSGERAPATRGLKVRMLWSNTGLYVRFEAEQGEPLIVPLTQH